ncbi:MAG: response regulator transcription factor [Deltaproteobacteria bacterium]|nr:response regulator transcription factor [Deltaproteobacteria bacterium]
MYRIVLAEDHALVREGIKKILEDFDDLQVVGEAGDAFQLLEMLKRLSAEMVVLDISLPGMSGIVAAKEIKKRHPQLRVLILTMHKKKEYLNDAIAAGADGYLLKEDVARELGSAISKIRHGLIYISPLLSNELASLFVQSRRVLPEIPVEPLTSREIEIVKLIAEGKSSREIADDLFLSFRTIQNHRTRIMRKLNLKKNTDLVKYAIQMGFIPAGEI